MLRCAVATMLLSSQAAFAWCIGRSYPVAPHRSVTMCTDGPNSASPDALLLAAMDALKNKEAARARMLLVETREAYDAAGGATDEQQQLLSMVAARVDAALVPGVSKTARRPPPPTREELELRAEAKARGDKALMRSVSVFGDKSDAERFGKALELLEEARAGFRRAGSDVEREREGVMGNLYSAIRAEEERAQRVAKLVRMKRLLELTKQKKKAETLGIDPDAFEEVRNVPSKSAAPSTLPASHADSHCICLSLAGYTFRCSRPRKNWRRKWHRRSWILAVRPIWRTGS